MTIDIDIEQINIKHKEMTAYSDGESHSSKINV